MDCLPGAHNGLFAAEGGFDLAFENDERIIEI
jgi:hypothetical protein